MKNLIFVTLLCVASIACDTKNEEVPDIPEQNVSASYRTSISVSVTGQPLLVTVLEINESRCPINADCIQAGSVDLGLSISDGTTKIQVPVSFRSDSKASGHQVFELGGQLYSLVVHEVLPYPTSLEPPILEAYKINLSIEKI